MRWASTISRQASTDLAVREAIAEARHAFGDLSADLVLSIGDLLEFQVFSSDAINIDNHEENTNLQLHRVAGG